MVSPEPVQAISRTSIDVFSSPRISFSSDFLDEDNFISITPNPQRVREYESEKEKARNAAEFEFLSSNFATQTMITADELFYDGKLLPCWQPEKLNKISLGKENGDQEKRKEDVINNKDECRMTWFLDDDPSPRPPKCTVLWKELLRLRKHRSSTLSPSSSSSSSSTSSSSLSDIVPASDEKNVKRVKKGLERTRSATIRIRPMVNVPNCTHQKSSSLPPLLPTRKGRLER